MLNGLPWKQIDHSVIFVPRYCIQPHYFMANRRGKGGSSHRFLFLGSKITVMVTAAMKSEDDCFLAGVSSVAQLFPNLCDPTHCSMPGFPVHHQLPWLAQTHVHWDSDAIHLILCCSLLLMPSIFPSIMVFSSESVLRIRWPKYWSFRFSISPSNEYSELISFRIDWFDLIAVKGTLKSLLQHHSSKASILQRSVFMVQLSNP